MKVALISVLVLLPLSTFAGVIMNTEYIDGTTGYTNSVFPIVYISVLAVMALFAFIFHRFFEIHYLSKEFDASKGDYTPTNISPYSQLIYSKNSSIVVFMSSFLGFAMLTSFFLLLFNLFTPDGQGIHRIVMVLLVAFMAMSGIFFIMSAAKDTSPYRRYFSILSFAPVICYSLRIISVFMDTTRYINTVPYYLELFTSILITLFFMFQSRFTLPDYKYHKLGTYFSCAIATVVLIFAFSVPSIISVAFFPYTVQYFAGNDIFFRLIDIIVAFYIMARLFEITTDIDQITEEDLKDYARGYTGSISSRM